MDGRLASGWIDRWIDRWMNEWMNEWTNEWTNVSKITINLKNLANDLMQTQILSNFCIY